MTCAEAAKTHRHRQDELFDCHSRLEHAAFVAVQAVCRFYSTPALKLAKAHCFHRRLWVYGLSAGQSSDPKRLQRHFQIAWVPCNGTGLLQLQPWNFRIKPAEKLHLPINY
ncbi:hypothetical protein [Desulfobotulus mexicanus]|uniref:Uncharacterized protein n=1 Tax=Desulfobotulus mexicanus TaxID=2586642 RepID=A0A5Q4VEN2_9BACT|nr:hypothetical protein [Desulfobotulus mexicanus]TYT76134.1 hypothetical protein FIM25_00840 [Desulfobotulus mexicanus]